MGGPTVHVCTVHWRSPRWIDIQLDSLARCVSLPVRTYGCLNDVGAGHADKFTVALDLPGRHPDKLNELARRVAENVAADDILLFIDGDAFPVAPIDAWLEETLQAYPLAAVRRDENNGDRQPHPCFCVTTVGFWEEVGGDWSAGSRPWLDTMGRAVTDVGGSLLWLLEDAGIEWYPLLRSNDVNLHPVFFAVYGDLVYHHGGGFRVAVSRADTPPGTTGRDIDAARRRGAVRRGLGRWEVARRRWRKARRWRRRWKARRVQSLSDDLYERIRHDPSVFAELTGGRVPCR